MPFLCEIYPTRRNDAIVDQLEEKVSDLEESLRVVLESAMDKVSLMRTGSADDPSERTKERMHRLHQLLNNVCILVGVPSDVSILNELLRFARNDNEEMLEIFYEEFDKIDKQNLADENSLRTSLSAKLEEYTRLIDSETDAVATNELKSPGKVVPNDKMTRMPRVQNAVKKFFGIGKKNDELEEKVELLKHPKMLENEIARLTGEISKYELFQYDKKIRDIQNSINSLNRLIAANERNFYTDYDTGETWPTGQVTTAAQTEALLEQDRLAAELKQ